MDWTRLETGLDWTGLTGEHAVAPSSTTACWEAAPEGFSTSMCGSAANTAGPAANCWYSRSYKPKHTHAHTEPVNHWAIPTLNNT